MSSIKLKHSGGNGVIIAAPSSNPAADRTITLPDLANNITLSNGITEVDSWRVTTAFTSPSSYDNYITANWARKSTSLNFAKRGTGMTESSGVFTFPSTGLWLVRLS